jgi:hypothetical protein
MTGTTQAAADLFGYVAPSIAPDETPRYPDAPGWRGPEGGTSHAAAQVMAPKVTGRRLAVMNYLRDCAPGPQTGDEIAAALDWCKFSIRPRLAELHAAGLIEPDEKRGRNESGMSANRWRAVPETQIQAQAS